MDAPLNPTPPASDAAAEADQGLAHTWLQQMWRDLRGSGLPPSVQVVGTERLSSVFPVTALASAAVGVAAASVAALQPKPPRIIVDQRRAALWFGWSLRPRGWSLPPAWDAIAGDYAAADGWIRLHTNAPRHRAAALAVLGTPALRADVSAAVQRWSAQALESAVVEAGGCAARMCSLAEWRAHPQAQAVAAEPLVIWTDADDTGVRPVGAALERPLSGLRVLDLTRVLAGPVATRWLAGFGADVLRIDPPGWDEPGVVAEVTLGKRCARLDLQRREHRRRFEQLLREAHVLVHGYRSQALERLGYDRAVRQALSPGLIDVSLNAYGWSGPWTARRGFDSLVQMSTGIAWAGMQITSAPQPAPLPVQALDHATGYLMAAAVLQALARTRHSRQGVQAQVSLARIAALLTSVAAAPPSPALRGVQEADWSAQVEVTPWGPAQRLLPPVGIEGLPMHWARGASTLGSADACW